MNYEVISDYAVNLSEEEIMPRYTKVKIRVDFGKKRSPEPVVIKWSIPGAGAAAIWQPLGGQATMIRPDWSKTQTPSRLALGMPIQVYYSQGGKNVMCVALTDVKTPCVLSSGIYEENANINLELKLFSELVTPIKRYEAELIIDRRKIPFYESIEGVRKIWENGQDKYVPEDAKLPLYSTWYSMHQELECEDLIKELEKAREYGMKNVIIDDGWQTEDNTRGYSFCGDWIPSESKVGKMRELTDRIHALGMKCMLWFSIPFVGEESLAYDKFKDKFIRKTKDAYDEKYTGVLDPRYPDVRNYLITTYEKAISEWGYDGVKLDFIDAIQFEGSADIKDGMDYASLEDATEALLESTYRRLRSINNDVLIEYRQPYIGPVMCEYSNMLRVADCPKNIIANRIGAVNLRLTSGNNAVHSDMLMWSYEESAEDAALQIINVLFPVIQISVRLEKLCESHRRMLKFYLDFAIKNKKLLLESPIIPYAPEAGYSMVCAKDDNSFLSVLYLQQAVTISENYSKITIVNGAAADKVIIDNEAESFEAEVLVYDCMGAKTESVCSIKNGVSCICVPKSGVVEISRK